MRNRIICVQIGICFLLIAMSGRGETREPPESASLARLRDAFFIYHHENQGRMSTNWTDIASTGYLDMINKALGADIGWLYVFLPSNCGFKTTRSNDVLLISASSSLMPKGEQPGRFAITRTLEGRFIIEWIEESDVEKETRKKGISIPEPRPSRGAVEGQALGVKVLQGPRRIQMPSKHNLSSPLSITNENVNALAALKPPEILAHLVQQFPGSTKTPEDRSAQYSVVQHYLDQYMVTIGSNLTVQSIVNILEQTEQHEILLANVFFWLHQSGTINRLDAQEFLVAYDHIEKTVRQSEGEAFQVGVGLLRRLLESEGANAMGGPKTAKVAAATIIEMIRKHLMYSDKGEVITYGVLEDVRKLLKRDMLEVKSYTDLLQSCITNISLRGGFRVRTATMLIQESTNSAEVVRLLQAEAENPRNDDAVRKEFSDLLNAGKP